MGISDYLYRRRSATDTEQGPASSTACRFTTPGAYHGSAKEDARIVLGPPAKVLTPIQEKDEAIDAFEERVENVDAPQGAVHAVSQNDEARAGVGGQAVAKPEENNKACEISPELWSTALWALPRRPPPAYRSQTTTPSPPPEEGHCRVKVDIHPTQAVQVALDSQRRLPPVFYPKLNLAQRMRKKARKNKFSLISASLIVSFITLFILVAVVVWWGNRPPPLGKVAHKVLPEELSFMDPEWWE